MLLALEGSNVLRESGGQEEHGCSPKDEHFPGAVGSWGPRTHSDNSLTGEQGFSQHALQFLSTIVSPPQDGDQREGF